jgi:hypothetical protein
MSESVADPASEATDTEEIGYRDKLYLDLFGPDQPGSCLAEKTKAIIRSEILPAYVRASLQAKRNVSLYRLAGTLVYCLVPLAVSAVAVAVLFPIVSAAAYFLEFLLLATILLVVVWADRRRSHRSWLSARFQVERLRAAIYFAACGVSNTGPALAGLEKVWAHTAAREPFQPQHRKNQKEFVTTSWIGKQISYHKIRSERCARLSRRLEWMGMIVFAAALLAAAIHAAPLFTGHSMHLGWQYTGLTLAAIVLPAAGAALGGLRSHREYSRLARISRGMTLALTDLGSRFTAAKGSEELTALLHEADNLMMRENQDWLELMSGAKLKASA